MILENDAVLVMHSKEEVWLVPEPREESYIIGGSQILKPFSDQLEELIQTMIRSTIGWRYIGTEIWREPLWKSPSSPSSERWEEFIWFFTVNYYKRKI